MISKLKTAPTTEPISLRQAKLNLRLAVTDADADAYDYENDLISRLITAARKYVEHYIDQRIGSQVWELYLDSWPVGGVINLPEAPVISVASIAYTDSDNVTTVFTDYYSDIVGNFLVLGSIPNATLRKTNSIKVTYTAGHTTAPSEATTAMHLIIGNMYTNRESVIIGTISSILPMGVVSMLDTMRRFN